MNANLDNVESAVLDSMCVLTWTPTRTTTTSSPTILRPPKHEARIAAPQLNSIYVGLNEFQALMVLSFVIYGILMPYHLLWSSCHCDIFVTSRSVAVWIFNRMLYGHHLKHPWGSPTKGKIRVSSQPDLLMIEFCNEGDDSNNISP